MGNSPDRILIFENDSAAGDLIGRQTLQPSGYQIQVLKEASSAAAYIQRFQPDALIVDLELPGLSGKDLLTSLASQGIQVPVIVIAQRGKEADAIQAFRLGASDYLIWPARDTEVLAVVERVFKQVRDRRERLSLSRQLQQTNQELQARVRELTAVSSVGKAITALAPAYALNERIMEGGMRVSGADLGWLLLCKEGISSFALATQRGLPANLARQLNQPWEDGLSSLVAASGETLSLYGEPLKKFTLIAQLGQAALVVPIKLNRQILGMLVVLRKTQRPFTPGEQALLETTAEYASIALGNLRTVQSLEARLSTRGGASSSEIDIQKARADRFRDLAAGLRSPLEAALDYTGQLLRGRKGRLPTEVQPVIFSIQEKLAQMNRIVLQLSSSSPASARRMTAVNLNDLSRQALARFHRLAQQNGLRLASDLASPPILAWGDPTALTQVLDGLVSNAIKFSRPGGQITLGTGWSDAKAPLLLVRDTGLGINPQQIAHLFDPSGPKGEPVVHLPANEAPDLHTIHEILSACDGKIRVESEPGQGTVFSVSLPTPREPPKP